MLQLYKQRHQERQCAGVILKKINRFGTGEAKLNSEAKAKTSKVKKIKRGILDKQTCSALQKRCWTSIRNAPEIAPSFYT